MEGGGCGAGGDGTAHGPASEGRYSEGCGHTQAEHHEYVKAADGAAEFDEWDDPVEQRVGQWNLPAAGQQVTAPVDFQHRTQGKDGKNAGR